jgi:hypothetical protein
MELFFNTFFSCKTLRGKISYFSYYLKKEISRIHIKSASSPPYEFWRIDD